MIGAIFECIKVMYQICLFRLSDSENILEACMCVERLDMKIQIEELFKKEYKKLFSIIYRITASHHDTEEVLQESFIKAYKNAEKFNGDSSLSTWVYRIVVNESYRYMKTWNKLPVVSITENSEITEERFFSSLNYEMDLSDELYIQEMREKCLHGFLNCVSQKGRVCFLLKTNLKLKNREIAEVLDTTEANVKVILHRTRKQLREMFEMRCSLIDPSKPCQCFLWVKYMRDNGMPFSKEISTTNSEYITNKVDTLSNYETKVSSLDKINQLYRVNFELDENSFINNLKKISEIL